MSGSPPFQAASTATAINTTLPLSGGGDLSASRTLTLIGPIGGLTNLTNHGVVIGQGTAPVVATAAGTAGQVLTSNGANADPTFQAGGGSQTLAQTLVNGNTTGGRNIAVSTGDGLLFGAGFATANTIQFGTGGGVTTQIQGPTDQDLVVSGSGARKLQLVGGSSVGISVDPNGNVALNNSGSALLTTATNGFTYIPSCAGVPTGVPASLPTGAVPMVVDTTTPKVWFYVGGAWKGVAIA